MFDFIKKLFCKHEWEYMGFTQEIAGNIRYPVRFYHCNKCHKRRVVDGRYDNILPAILAEKE